MKDEIKTEVENLRKLVKRWLKRRGRLGQQASDLRKVKTDANLMHSNQFFGRFNEIEKCRSELVTILNRIEKLL